MTVRAKTTPASTPGSFAATPAVRSRVELDPRSAEVSRLANERRYRFSNPANPITPVEAEHVAGLELDGFAPAAAYWRMRRYGAGHDDALGDAATVAADRMAIEWYGSVRAGGGTHAEAMDKVRSVHTHSYDTERETRPMPDGGSEIVWLVSCACGHVEERRLSGRYTGD